MAKPSGDKHQPDVINKTKKLQKGLDFSPNICYNVKVFEIRFGKGGVHQWQNAISAEKVSLSVLRFLTHTDAPTEPTSPTYKR